MTGLPGKPSIIFITIDCLRADHVGCLGCGITPAIDGLARESLLFSKAIVAGSPTYNSFPALLAGRFPLERGRDALGIGAQETTLASCLQAQGYRTGAIVAGNPYAGRWMGYDQGFDYFEDFLQGKAPDGTVNPAAGRDDSSITWLQRVNRQIQRLTNNSPTLKALYQKLSFPYSLWVVGRRHRGDYSALLNIHPGADIVTDKAITWLEGVNGPFFLWLHYMDAHRPYWPSPAALEKIGRADISPKKMFQLRNIWLRTDLADKSLMRYRQDFMDLYAACITSIDSQLERLWAALGNLGIKDDSLIVLTADHGETFLEHGERVHAPVLANQEIINVPLVIHAPAGQRITRMETSPFSHIDLWPTLLDLAGLSCPPAFSGQSRWPNLRDGKSWQDPAVTEMIYGYDSVLKGRFNPAGQRLLAATAGRHKLMVNFAKGSMELFDLEADPQEQFPQALSMHPSAARQLLEILDNHLARSMQGRHSRLEVTMRFEKIKQLFSSYNH